MQVVVAVVVVKAMTKMMYIDRYIVSGLDTVH